MKGFAMICSRILLIGLLCGPAWLLADWPQWRGEGRNGFDAHSPRLMTELPAEGLTPLWINKETVAEGRGEGWSSPVVAEGRVYFYSHARGKDDKREEHIFCLNANTGEEVWHKTIASRATKVTQSGTPAVVSGRVFVLGAGRMARCLDAASGDELWSRELPGEGGDEPWHASFAVADNVAIVFAGRLFGLNAENGEVLWQGEDAAKEGVHGSPALANIDGEQLAIAHVGQGETVALDLKSGKQRWRVKTEAVASSPVIVGDLLVTLGQSRKGGLRCYRMSGEDAKLVWKNQSLADPGASPVVVGEHVYAQGERKLACLRLSDGEVAWTTELPIEQPRYTSLLAADGQVFYAFDSLLAFAADPQEYRALYHGRLDKQGLLADEQTLRKTLKLEDELVSSDVKAADKLWKEKLGDCGPYTCTSPAIADGRLYLRLRQGIACYDLSRSSSSASR
jgi:outer membrane protein assembly factor BamB